MDINSQNNFYTHPKESNRTPFDSENQLQKKSPDKLKRKSIPQDKEKNMLHPLENKISDQNFFFQRKDVIPK